MRRNKKSILKQLDKFSNSCKKDLKKIKEENSSQQFWTVTDWLVILILGCFGGWAIAQLLKFIY